jgi:hypothetical protein
MKKLLLFLLLFSACIASSQNFQWVKTPPITYGLNPDMIGYVNTVDHDQNVYFAGYKESSFLYGADIMGNLYYNKYDAAGNLLFSNTIVGHATAYEMVADTEGNILMAVGFVSTITIDDITIAVSADGVKPILLKFDADGNLSWYYMPAIENGVVDNFRAVTTDTANYIFIGFDNYSNSYVNRLTPDGNPDMTILQQNVKRLTSITVDTEGNIYTAGSCAENNAIYAGVSVPTSLSYNSYVAKYNAAGAYQWMKYVEDITCSEPKVRANTPDQVYLCSHLYGAFAFDDIIAEGPMSGTFNDFFLGKLNSEGSWQWVREVPGTGVAIPGHRNYLGVDANGNAYIAGSTNGTVNWGNGVVSTTTSSDAAIIEFSPEGIPLMAKTAGSTSQDRVDNVTASGSSIVVSGMTRGASAFDAITFAPVDIAFYPFVGKIESTLGLDHNQMESIRVYPNPAFDVIYFSNITSDIGAAIYNVLGQKVRDVTISADTALDIHELCRGIYLIKADAITHTMTIK